MSNTYKEKIKNKLQEVKTAGEFDIEEKRIAELMNIARQMYARKVDSISPTQLQDWGMTITGLLASLANDSATARAKKDIAEMQKDIEYKESYMAYKTENGTVTDAKYRADIDVQGWEEQITIQEYEKRSYENLYDACRAMLSFIQTVLKQKENERYGRHED